MSKTPEDLELAARVCGWLRYAQKDLGLSQNELARRLGMESGTLSRYMTGVRGGPSIGFVLKVWRYLKGVRAQQFLEEDPPATYMDQAPRGPPIPRQAPRESVAPGRPDKAARKARPGS